MIRLHARLFPSLAAALALGANFAVQPLAAQDQPDTFNLPAATPTPTPAPAGPADERAGVAIPPRPPPVPTPVIQPLPSPSASQPPLTLPTPPRRAPAATPLPRPSAPAPTGASAAAPPPLVYPEATSDPLAVPSAPAQTLPAAPPPAAANAPVPNSAAPALPAWWPWAAGGLGALALIGGGMWLARRRRPKTLRLAAPATVPARGGGTADPAADLPRLDLTLEITSATRSLMMFTMGWRLTVANRSDRAVNDVQVALALACARASANADNAPSAGRAQCLGLMPRIGPHQAGSITGEVQLPLSAVQPLRQGTTPLFVPLVHVTLGGESLPAITRSFVIGTRSASGRVHPIMLDQPPGTIAGLVAQAIAIPPVSAAA